MTYLPDTNFLPLSMYQQNRLEASARAMLLDEEHPFAFSVARIADVAGKDAGHQDTFNAGASQLRNGLRSLEYQERRV